MAMITRVMQMARITRVMQMAMISSFDLKFFAK